MATIGHSLVGVGAVGGVASSDTTEELLLVIFGLISKTINDLLNTVNSLGDNMSREMGLGLGGLAVALSAVAVSVSQDNFEDLLGTLSFTFLIFGDSAGALDGGRGGRLGGIVEAGGVEGVARPLVAVELFEESIVFSGEAPNNAVGSLHSALNVNSGATLMSSCLRRVC